jgi:undecaprenyl phosphate-alpha-L-ara4FN deformylase
VPGANRLAPSIPLEISLKVDVCNRRALEEGVPSLLRILGEFNIRASFFVTFGPDNSGKAIRRVFHRGFIRKMIRTGAPSTYGLKTILYGTLLPAPPVGEALPQLLKDIEEAGHEVGLHGWNHVDWHDGLPRMAAEDVRESYGRASRLFEQSLGHKPLFSGAPGWQASSASLRVQEEFGFIFASDCRGHRPFYPQLEGMVLKTLQIPATLPTSDELLGLGGIKEHALADYYLSHLKEHPVNILGMHAEVEGLKYVGWLRFFLAGSLKRGGRFPLLSEIARRERETAQAGVVVQREIAGRSGTVACQKGVDE